MPKDIAKRFGVAEGVIEMDLYQIANTLFPGAPKNDPSLAALARDIPRLACLAAGNYNKAGFETYQVPEPNRYVAGHLQAVRDGLEGLNGATAAIFGGLLAIGLYRPTRRDVAFAVEALHLAELDGDMHYFENENAVILAASID